MTTKKLELTDEELLLLIKYVGFHANDLEKAAASVKHLDPEQPNVLWERADKTWALYWKIFYLYAEETDNDAEGKTA